MEFFDSILNHFHNFFVELSLLSWQECVHQWSHNHLFRMTCKFSWTNNSENLAEYIWCRFERAIYKSYETVTRDLDIFSCGKNNNPLASFFCSSSDLGSSTQDDWWGGPESWRRNGSSSNVFLYLSGISLRFHNFVGAGRTSFQQIFCMALPSNDALLLHLLVF